MQFKYIDIHSHLNLSPLWEKRAEVVARMREEGVATVTIGTDLETSKRAIQTAEEFPDVVLGATVGLHPSDASAEALSEVEGLKEFAKHPKVVAIGETGLDYYRMEHGAQNIEQKEKQKEIFKKHIELAMEAGKPLMIHARPSKGTQDAYEEVLGILEIYKLKASSSKLSCNFHFFVGDLNIAKRIVENGWSMSFDGPITFTNEYDEVIKNIPIENIMTETDAPFAAPAPWRGRGCEPWMVKEIYKKIAEIKGVEEESVREKLTQNALKFFDLKI